jgi:IS30 family transposase
MAPETYTLREASEILDRPVNTVHSWLKRNRDNINHIKTESGEILLDEHSIATLRQMSDNRRRVNKGCAKKSIGQDVLFHHGKKMRSVIYISRKLKRSVNTIYNWIARHDVPNEHIGSRVYVPEKGYNMLVEMDKKRFKKGKHNRKSKKVTPAPATSGPAPAPAPTENVSFDVTVVLSKSDAAMINVLERDIGEVANKAVNDYIADFKRRIQDIL